MLDRFEYEYEYRPPRRTEYEYDENARTKVVHQSRRRCVVNL